MTVLNKQRGSTLLVALVMLMLLTLIAFTAMNASTTSIQVVGNAQFREEATAAAQKEIEKVISSNFTANPVASSAVVPVGGSNYVVNIAAPTCKSSMPLPSDSPELDKAKLEDQECMGKLGSDGTLFGPGGVPVTTSSVICFKQTWEVNATVDDSDTGARANVHQGVFLRVQAGTGCVGTI
jgi:type II secretory pathway pseudopilin PulG